MRGRYRELDPPNRVVFTWGFAAGRAPPGSSTVEVLFVREAGGKRVEIVHSGLPPARRLRHAEGWRKYLDRLAIAVGPGS